MSFQPPYGQVQYEVKDGVAWVTINNPSQQNALTPQVHADLRAIWIQTNIDQDVRAIVLTGAGADFCAGGDLTEQDDALNGAGSVYHTKVKDFAGKYAHRMYEGAEEYGLPDRARGLPGKPLIVAVHGACSGPGLFFVAESDFAICSDDATFSDPQVTQGMAAGREAVANIRLRNMPRGVGLRLAYLGGQETLSAERAREVGYVTEIVPAGQLQSRAAELAGWIAAAPPLVTRALSAAMWDTWSMPYDQARLWSHAYMTQVVESADAKTGLTARRAGQSPTWAGR